MNIKDKVFYISIVAIIIALVACGVCYGLGLIDYVGVSVCGVVTVGLLYAKFQDNRHEKMATLKKEKEENNN